MRVAALALRICRQMLRDRRTLFLIFFVPLLIMSLLTWLLRAEGQPFRLAVIGAGENDMARGLLVQLLQKDTNIKIVEGVGPDEVDAALKSGRVQGALTLSGAGMEEIKSGGRMKIEVALEGSDVMVGREFFREFQTVVRPFLDALRGLVYLSDEDAELLLPPEVTRRYIYGGEDFTETDYFAPPLIGFMVFFFVFLLTAVSFLRERAQGTMERLLASPIARSEIIAGYFLGLLGFALVQTAVVILFALYVLDVRYVGSMGAVLAVELVLVIGASNMGILFSTFAKNEFQVAQFIPLVILPQVFLSGVLWSVESMPRALQMLAYALPLTYANFALRDIMIKGYTLWQVGPELLALALFALIMVAGSVGAMRRMKY